MKGFGGMKMMSTEAGLEQTEKNIKQLMNKTSNLVCNLSDIHQEVVVNNDAPVRLSI
jgi:hypothetical protein